MLREPGSGIEQPDFDVRLERQPQHLGVLADAC